MSVLNFTLVAAIGPTAALTLVNQDINKTIGYANGGGVDQTDIEVSGDGANWVKIGGRQTGSVWLINLVGKFAAMRLNRIAIDPSVAPAVPVAFVGANDIIAAAAQGAGPGATALGQYTINSQSQSVIITFPGALTPTTIATFGTQADGIYQVEIDLVYRNSSTLQVGSRKVTGTVRRLAGILTIEAQQNPAIYLNDNAVFGANINTVLAVTGTTIQLLMNAVSAAANINCVASGVINYVA